MSWNGSVLLWRILFFPTRFLRGPHSAGVDELEEILDVARRFDGRDAVFLEITIPKVNAIDIGLWIDGCPVLLSFFFVLPKKNRILLHISFFLFKASLIFFFLRWKHRCNRWKAAMTLLSLNSFFFSRLLKSVGWDFHRALSLMWRIVWREPESTKVSIEF